MRIKRPVAFLLPCLLLLGAVSGEAQRTANGAPRLHLRPVVQIGGDFVPEGYAFQSVGDIAVSRGRDIYVLDDGSKTVRRFAADGQLLSSFGREGGGPGEFRFPLAIQVDSLVRVFDGAHQRVSLFSLEGVHRTTHPLPEVPGLTVTIAYPLRGGGALATSAARFSPGTPGHQPNYFAVHRAPGRTRLDTLISYHSGAVLWHPADGFLPWGVAPSEFGAGGAVAVQGDSVVAVADGYDGSVRWYRASERGLQFLREAKIGMAAHAVSDADLAAVERALRATGGKKPRRLKLSPPPQWSIASRALFADDGALWVRSSANAERGFIWTMFSPDGAPPRRFRLPVNFDLQAIHGDRMYGVSRTENDAPVVRVYEWSWV